jgi:uncharacterized protein (TIGR02246 family)
MRYIILTAAAGLTGLALALGQAPTADEEKAVRAAVDSYTAAFDKGDLDGLLAHITDDADFINEDGTQYKGKAGLAGVLKRSLAELKGHTLKTTLTSVRFVRPDVAVADGTAEITAPDGATDSGRFTAVWAKADGKWLLSSVRDLPDSAAAPESAPGPLQQFEWLVGDWAHEGPNHTAQMGGRWTLNKNFLLLEYAVKGKDGEDMTVVQYVGWDPADGVIRSWFFDSQGGYGGGDWVREGNTWTAQCAGMLPEGQAASSVNSIQFIDDQGFIFRSVDRAIDGLPVADMEVKFVRKAAGK